MALSSSAWLKPRATRAIRMLAAIIRDRREALTDLDDSLGFKLAPRFMMSRRERGMASSLAIFQVSVN